MGHVEVGRGVRVFLSSRLAGDVEGLTTTVRHYRSSCTLVVRAMQEVPFRRVEGSSLEE